jgi:hypothetical protein
MPDVGDLIYATAGTWITRPPTRCPHGHDFGAGRVLVGYQACLGHTTWTCQTCDETVFGPPLNTHCKTLDGPATVRISTARDWRAKRPRGVAQLDAVAGHTDTVAAVFTCTHCNAVPEQVVDGNAQLAIVRHDLGCPTLLAQTRVRWPAGVVRRLATDMPMRAWRYRSSRTPTLAEAKRRGDLLEPGWGPPGEIGERPRDHVDVKSADLIGCRMH